MEAHGNIGRCAQPKYQSEIAKRDDRIHDTVMSFINWGLFEIPGVNLDDIDIPVITYSQGDLPSKDDVLVGVALFRENVEKLQKALIPPPEEPSEGHSPTNLKSNVEPSAVELYLTRITNELPFPAVPNRCTD